MNYNLIKKIFRIALVGSVLYFLTFKEAIAPASKYFAVESGKSLIKRKIIVLDPGHGMGNRVKGLMDWGMNYKSFNEAEIVLEKVKNIKKMLDSTKYKVILTRQDNKTPCSIESRPKLANENNADIFLSLHTNDYHGWKSINGSEIYWKERKDKELAKLAAKNLEEIALIHNRRVIQEEYLMLKNVKCPAILIEMGYPLNEHDKEKIMKGNGVEKAIVKTIEDYLK